MWHVWAVKNGNTYLLAGEDYQGYSVVNVTTGKVTTAIDNGAEKGFGFCFADVKVDGDELVVIGCYWAAPYERRVYDFSNPENLPYPLLDWSEDE